MKKIKYFIMDVDGTLTDGKIYIGNQGELFKAFDIKDGCGIHDILIPEQILPVIITGRESEILKIRCEELGISCLFQGIHNKVEKLKEILDNSELSYENVAYIGDDLNDLDCMNVIKMSGGIIGCPNNAVNEVKSLADFVSTRNGGDGAVREFIEWIIRIQ